MLDRETVLKIVDTIYAARVAADKETIAGLWAPDASFRISLDHGLLQDLAFDGDPMLAVAKLVDRFDFKAMRRLDAIVEGNKAAVHFEVDMIAGGRAITSRMMDFFEFSDDGKIASLEEFVDTALMLKLMEPDGATA